MKLLSVASARPNFVKLAAIDHACHVARERRGVPPFSDVEHVIVHTGQHYDPVLSDVFFEQLKITQPAHNLGVHGGTREEVIERTMQAMMPVLEKEKPDVVLVYGDVNGAVGAARAAKKLGIKLAHVEAGLRSFDMSMPEELNRIEVDGLADLLFCSEESGMKHLEKEGVGGKRFLVGNTMIDTLLRMLPEVEKLPLPFDAAGEKYVLATLHRPSNVDDEEHLKNAIRLLNKVGEKIHVVLPAHPRLRESLERSELVLPGPDLFVIPPLSYLEFIRQAKNAQFIVTDSGGIQEEAVLLGKKCFTLRLNTERPSTLESGSNELIDPSDLHARQKVINFAEALPSTKIIAPKEWDGHAGERIVDVLRSLSAA